MKKIITTNITASASMPIKSGTLDHLQAAYGELMDPLSRAIIGKDIDLPEPYALIGCNNIATLPDVDIQDGYIYYLGVLYQVAATAFTPGGGQVAVANYVTTYLTAANADPVEFTDANNHNVHEIKKIAFTSAVSGSGLFDYSDLRFVEIQPGTDVTYLTGWDGGTGTGLRYRKNRDGLVTIEGVAFANGTPGFADPIFQLPAGFRPPIVIQMPCTAYDGANFHAGYIQIDTGGDIIAVTGIGPVYSNDDAIFLSCSFYNS